MQDKYCRIPLTGGTHALVDPEDYERFAQFTWRQHSEGYAVRQVWNPPRSRNCYLHREVLGLSYGDGLQADHINRDRLDCRRSNLRVVTNAQNSQNRPGRVGGTSAYRGVHWDTRRALWIARVKINYKHHLVGAFDDEQEAARAVAAFRREHTPYSRADLAA